MGIVTTGYQTIGISQLKSGSWFEFDWTVSPLLNYIIVDFSVIFSDIQDGYILSGKNDPFNGIKINSFSDGKITMWPFIGDSTTEAGYVNSIHNGLVYRIRFLYTPGGTPLHETMLYGVKTTANATAQSGSAPTYVDTTYRMDALGCQIGDVNIHNVNTIPVYGTAGNVLSAALDNSFVTTVGNITNNSDANTSFVGGYKLDV